MAAVKEKKEKKEKTVTHDPYRKLTVSQRAEAAALWRTGTVTLEDLGKKFKKRPEAISRILRSMGAAKGEGAVEAAKKIAEEIESKTLSSVAETIKKIHTTKDEHYRMSRGLAQLAWSEIVRARQAKLPLESLKDVMMTLKLAGDVIGNSRKEIFDLLNVEKHDKSFELEELPELMIRELTHVEILQLQTNVDEDLDIENDVGADMHPDAPSEGL